MIGWREEGGGRSTEGEQSGELAPMHGRTDLI